MTADVSGTTPLGPFNGTYALYANAIEHCSAAHHILVAESVEQLAEMLCENPCCDYTDPGLRIEMWGEDWDALMWQGTAPAYFDVQIGGMEESIQGDITITALDAYPEDECPDRQDPWPTMVASFDLDTGGWVLSGQIQAPYCKQLNKICP